MKNKGFTLIELAVVLAIIAVLAAVLTPVVTGYLDQARIARAQADVRVIADSIKLYRNDTGVYPFASSSTNAAAGTMESELLATANGNSVSTSGWTAGVGANTIESYLNANIMSRSTTAVGGRVVFRGPYIGTVESDPWSNKYYLTADHLDASATHWAFVVSAGPNGTIDTTKDQDKTGTLTVGGDDLAAAIR